MIFINKFKDLNNYKKNNSLTLFLVFFLVLTSVVSFFLGFYFNENSAGAGGFKGDFSNVWNNINLLKKYDLKTFFCITAKSCHEISDTYISSRTPLLYLVNYFLNPFVSHEELFRVSIFVFSLLIPIFFFYSLKKRYPSYQNILLVFVTSIILLSPYFRTSSYWGLEENYALLTTLLTYIFFIKFIKKKNNKNIFLLTFFASLTVYFDIKFLIVPLITFFKIINSKIILKKKIQTIILFFLFSLPYVYLIFLWKNIIPTNDAINRNAGLLFFQNIGYSITLIFFYIFPFIIINIRNFYNNFIKLLKNKFFFLFLIIIFTYLIFFIFYYNIFLETKLGKGYAYKLAILLFENYILQKIFLSLIILIGFFSIIVFFNNKVSDFFIIIYFIFFSIFTYPLMQEYYDPILFIMFFLFFFKKIEINFFKVLILYVYFFSFLVFAFNYYKYS